jgi:hypothetical protein
MPTLPVRLPRFTRAACLTVILVSTWAWGQTPPPPAKRLPPAGIQISDADRAELTAAAAALRRDLDALAREFATGAGAPEKARLAALLPDVEIFHKAVDWALR